MPTQEFSLCERQARTGQTGGLRRLARSLRAYGQKLRESDKRIKKKVFHRIRGWKDGLPGETRREELDVVWNLSLRPRILCCNLPPLGGHDRWARCVRGLGLLLLERVLDDPDPQREVRLLPVGARGYVINRGLRIFPAYYAACILLILVYRLIPAAALRTLSMAPHARPPVGMDSLVAAPAAL